MLQQLALNNIYFSVYIFLFLTLFSAFWLHLDTWKLDKQNHPYLNRAIGFLFLSVAFLITSTEPKNELLIYTLNTSKIFGSLMLLIGLTSTQILKNPIKNNTLLFFPITLSNINNLLLFATPLFFIAITLNLFIKIKKGLEKQLTGLASSFVFLSLAEMLKSLYFWSGSDVVYINYSLSKFGPIAIIILLFEFIGAVILIKWVWGYVRFRAGIQIFLTTLGLSLFIFIMVTFSFTYLLLKNVEDNILESLTTDAKVALYSIERLQLEAMANSKVITNSEEIIDSNELANDLLTNQGLNFIYVTNKEGVVVSTSPDSDLKNISLSEDPTFKSAIKGIPLSTIYKQDGAISPTIEIKAGVPILNQNKNIVGTVITGFLVDNALLDGIKELTGMEITVFGENVRSASTVNLDNEKTRFLGIPETNTNITDQVINKGLTWSGTTNIVNKPYYSTYLPLKSYNGKIIGMVSVSKPQSVLIKTSDGLIQNTFLVSALLLIFSTLPAYFVAHYIEENTTA